MPASDLFTVHTLAPLCDQPAKAAAAYLGTPRIGTSFLLASSGSSSRQDEVLASLVALRHADSLLESIV